MSGQDSQARITKLEDDYDALLDELEDVEAERDALRLQLARLQGSENADDAALSPEVARLLAMQSRDFEQAVLDRLGDDAAFRVLHHRAVRGDAATVLSRIAKRVRQEIRERSDEIGPLRAVFADADQRQRAILSDFGNWRRRARGFLDLVDRRHVELQRAILRDAGGPTDERSLVRPDMLRAQSRKAKKRAAKSGSTIPDPASSVVEL